MKIRVLIVEDQRLLRQCFAQVLGADPEIEVVATAANGEEAVLEAVRHRPDVALMDLEMPVLDGAQASRLIRERAPEVRVLILSRHSTPVQVYQAIATGVSGYILKDVPPQELVRIVKGVHRNEEVDSPYLADERLRAERLDAKARFNHRETEMLGMLVKGMSNAEMADKLCVSEQTVKRDMMAVLEKLEVENRTQAAVRIVELGLNVEGPIAPAPAAPPPGPEPT